MRIVFVGTPESAATCLRTLIWEKFDILAVFTRPDAPKGRHLHLTPSRVKRAAVEAKVPVLQFEKASSVGSVKRLRALEPDVIVVVAFGEILSEEFLSIPKTAIVNAHFSLLPKYRGAAPVHWAVISGEKETGVTIQHMAKKLDTGDVILQKRVPIAEDDTAGTLLKKLARVGGELLVEALRHLEQGTAPRIPQDESAATYARKLTKSDGELDWHLAAKDIVNRVRGMNPWPGAYTFVLDKGCRKTFKILQARRLPHDERQPGEVLQASDCLVVAAGEGAVEFLHVQLEGKRPMDVGEFLRGHPIPTGTVLG